MPLSVEAEQRKDVASAKFYAKRKDLFTNAQLAHVGYIIRNLATDIDEDAQRALIRNMAVAAKVSEERLMGADSTVTSPEFQHRQFAVIAAVVKSVVDAYDLGSGKMIVMEFTSRL